MTRISRPKSDAYGAEGERYVRRTNSIRGSAEEMLRARPVLAARKKCRFSRKLHLTAFGLHSWRPTRRAGRTWNKNKLTTRRGAVHSNGWLSHPSWPRFQMHERSSSTFRAAHRWKPAHPIAATKANIRATIAINHKPTQGWAKNACVRRKIAKLADQTDD